MKLFAIRNHTSPLRKCIILTGLLLILSGSASLLYAQVEDDTTRVEREIPETEERDRYNNFIITPFQAEVSESDINRYQIDNYNNQYGFYRRLQYQTPEDFIMSEDTGYNRYGPEWEREINAQLIAILQATFKEQNSILNLLSRIAPFLGFGFFEQYEVPIVPRNEDPDRVYVDD